MKVLIVGGSKSGKSHLAQRAACALSCGGPLYYWATMDPADDEDRERIRKHLEDRAGWGFMTVEHARNISAAPPLPRNSAVLFDSATALVTNEMFGDFDPDRPFVFDESCAVRCASELLQLASSVRSFILVADDVFRDGRVYDELTEHWRKTLAAVLKTVAREFDSVTEVSAGLMHAVKGELPPLAPDMTVRSERRST